jgi:glyoxylase-like metal-dependent hydrolase (beta-lactamase superfamily II)
VGSLRDGGHTNRHARRASGHKRNLFSGDGRDPDLWGEGRCPRGRLYDGPAGQCSGELGGVKRQKLDNHIHHAWHGHHWFGVGTLLERFPNARVVATPNTVKVMRQNASPEAFDGAWKLGFPGQIPDKLVIAAELEGNVIDLEGNELIAVQLGHTDTDHTTCLNAPSIGLVVAGDAAYNDVHLYLAESNALKRQEWIAALDKIQSLNPRVVVASHERPDNDDNSKIIEETRQYIRDFDRLAETTRTAQELYDKMLELYPNRVNPGWALWSSARAVKP